MDIDPARLRMIQQTPSSKLSEGSDIAPPTIVLRRRLPEMDPERQRLIRELNSAPVEVFCDSRPREAFLKERGPVIEKASHQMEVLKAGISSEQVRAAYWAAHGEKGGMISKARVLDLTNGMVPFPLAQFKDGTLYFLPKGKLVAVGGFKHVRKGWKVRPNGDVEPIARLAIKGNIQGAMEEIALTKRFDHPHLMSGPYHSCQYDGPSRTIYGVLKKPKVFASLPLMLGDLRELAKTLTWKERVEVCQQIASGLADLHSRGIIHRDIKPENILLTRGPQGEPIAKIGDFGLSREKSSLKKGTRAGTSQYFAPEVGQKGVLQAEASDCYALGLTFEKILGAAELDPSDRPKLMQTETSLTQRLKASEPDKRPTAAQVEIEISKFLE